MTKFLFDVTHISEAGKRSQHRRMVERDWPGVPRDLDLVSLGGGDLVLEHVSSVEFLDGWITLSILIKESENGVSAQTLKDLGFEPPSSPDEPPAVS